MHCFILHHFQVYSKNGNKCQIPEIDCQKLGVKQHWKQQILLTIFYNGSIIIDRNIIVYIIFFYRGVHCVVAFGLLCEIKQEIFWVITAYFDNIWKKIVASTALNTLPSTRKEAKATQVEYERRTMKMKRAVN